MLPMWTPYFLLCLMILACVWGMPLMLNRDALEGIFRHHESADGERVTPCPVALNPIKALISWPNEGVIKYKEAKPEQVFGQEGPQENKVVQVPFNFQNLELQPVIEAKEDKVLEQNKESKVQGNGKETIRRAPNRELQGNVKERKSRLVNYRQR